MNPIRESLEWLREHGWTQGASINARGEVCTLGALRLQDLAQCKFALTMPDKMIATLSDEQKDRMYACLPYLARVIKDQYFDWCQRFGADNDYFLVFMWNDERYRTFEEVEMVFEKAAVLWDEVNT